MGGVPRARPACYATCVWLRAEGICTAREVRVHCASIACALAKAASTLRVQACLSTDCAIDGLAKAGECHDRGCMWFDRRSAADRALVAPHTKRKQQAEAEEHDAPQGRMTLELRARSVIDDTSEERPFGRSRARSCASLGPAWGASLGPAWAALHAARHPDATRRSASPRKSVARLQVLGEGKLRTE